MNAAISRRALIGLSMAAAARPAYASGKVVVGAWGDDYAASLRKLAAPLLTPKSISLVLDTSGAAERKARVLAERHSKTGSFDVVCLNDIDMYILSLPQLLRPDTAAQLSNLVRVYPSFRVPYGVPQMHSALVLIWRPDLVHAKLGSYADLWQPSLKGRVGFADPLYREVLGAATLAHGGSMGDFARGKKAIAALKAAGARSYGTSAALGAALKSGEIWATLCWHAHGYMWTKDGTPLEQHVAEEGAVPVVIQAAVPINAPNSSNGFAFLDALLAPKVQKGFASRMGFLPTVETVKLSDHEADDIGFTTYQRERFVALDYDYLARNSGPLLTFWNRTFNR